MVRLPTESGHSTMVALALDARITRNYHTSIQATRRGGIELVPTLLAEAYSNQRIQAGHPGIYV